MGDIVFNVAKGKVNEYLDRVNNGDPANSAIIAVLLKVVEADGLLKDYDTLAAILAGANTEADFTNYLRKTLAAAAVGPSTVDDASDRRESDLDDQTWSAAGGASNNNLVKLVICYDPDTTGGTDAAIVPLTAHDFVVPTNGGDIVAQVATFFRAA